MNKKIIIIAVLIAVIALTAVFISPKEAGKETTAPEGQPITVNIEDETTKKEKEISYNKKVTVTLPAEFIGEEYKDNLDAFAEANGYDWVKITKDGSVKVKMRALSYSLILSNVGMDTIQSIAYTMDSGEFPYFTDLVKYNDDFSNIIVAVNKEEYEKAENRSSLLSQIALAGLYYQSYNTESENKCEITVCEEGTNLLIETRTFTVDELENIQ